MYFKKTQVVDTVNSRKNSRCYFFSSLYSKSFMRKKIITENKKIAISVW